MLKKAGQERQTGHLLEQESTVWVVYTVNLECGIQMARQALGLLAFGLEVKSPVGKLTSHVGEPGAERLHSSQVGCTARLALD